MEKGGKLLVLFLAAVTLGGCSFGGTKKEVKQVDFQAKMELRSPSPKAGERPRILFVGNSHMFYNDLSGTFARIADNLGRNRDAYELSKSQCSLKQYADMENELGKVFDKTVSGKKWDFVILQESSDNAMSLSAEEEMFPYCRILDEKVKSAGGQTVFLMTWAPKDGIKDGFKKQSREELQSIMVENYTEISDELNSLMIPAGVAFMRCAQEYPEIELWNQDGKYPSPAGTYLAACTVYAVIYQQSPENCSYVGELDNEVAAKLQKLAAELVLG
ncbi:MAG: hypothetical protein HFG59_09140 [Lachnospiraceae bacterium]|nr:hypothetical protein [Lachnospiraceae bacterium]